MPTRARGELPPSFLVKLYRKYNDPPDAFALGIYVASDDDDTLSFVGLDAQPFRPPRHLPIQRPWVYERLELFADGKELTFAIPVVSTNDTGDDFLKLDFGNPALLTLKCHMLLLVGEEQADSRTTVGLNLQLYRSAVVGGKRQTLFYQNSQIGATAFGNSFSDPVPLSQFPLWLSREGPWQSKGPIYEKVGGKTPGPLLKQAYDSNFTFPDPSNDNLPRVDVVYLKSAVIKTLALVYRARPDDASFPLPISPTGIPPNRFFLPVIDPERISDPVATRYRIVQRPSDNWLNRSIAQQDVHEEWTITFDTVGLDDLWNQAVRQYVRSLRTVRPVNRITLLPHIVRITRKNSDSDIDTADELGFTLSCVFSVQRKVGASADSRSAQLADLTISPFRLNPLGELEATLRFDLGDRGAIDRNAVSKAPLEVLYNATIVDRFKTSEAALQQDLSLYFQAQLEKPTETLAQPTEPAKQSSSLVQVRIGSMDLDVGGLLPQTNLSLVHTYQLQQVSGYWNKVPRMSGDMWLPVKDVEPGGQDGLPASEYEPEGYNSTSTDSEICIEQRFDGSAPVVIPVNPAAPAGSFLLKIHEENPTLYSETVSLELHYVAAHGETASAENKARVVIIDSDPFLIAAVDYSPLSASLSNGSDIVALWNTGSLDGQSWRLQTNSKPFDMLLSSQGIGEEMPKAFELYAANGDSPPDSVNPKVESPTDPLLPLDFRFSPAARQRLNASYTPQNYTDAPWNLRRILGYPGQRDAGAGVVELNYELLYGLSCSVDTPLLRLAEIFSLVGRVPGRVPLLNIPNQDGSPTLSVADQKKYYEQKRWDWSLLAQLYSKRVAILEPRASGSDYGDTVGATGASAAPEEFTLSQGISCTFRGSADLYYSVNPVDLAGLDDNTLPKPHDPAGLRGGVSWPFESARLFHATVRNPKSSSTVASGLALSSLGGTGTVKAGFDNNLSTISSITEIARTSKLSVSRLGRIGVFHNLARYVIEYERDTSVSQQFNLKQTPFEHRPVLRKVREFVEILEPIGQLSNDSQTYPGGGCVKSIEFKQRIIPVTNTWSSNVGANGWKIPLWYEPDSHSKGDGSFVYELPEVVFNLAGADGSDVECILQSVDKLCFYTETDANADADPHKWPIASGVDFLPVPPPSANPAFPTSTVHEIPANDPPIPFGLAAFTHHIAPGHGRVNLVNGRSAQAIGATITHLTLQRAPLAVPAVQNQLQSLHDEIRTNVYKAVRQNPASLIPKNPLNLQDPANAVCAYTQAAFQRVKDQLDSLANTALQQEATLVKVYIDQIRSSVDTFVDELKTQLHEQTTLVGQKLADVQAKIEISINLEVNAFTNRLDGIPASANALQKFFARVCMTLKDNQTELENRKAALKAALNSIQVTASHDAKAIEDSLAQLQATLTGPIDQVKILLAQVKSQIQSASETWMPGVTFICQQWESVIFPSLSQSEAIIAQTESALAFANSEFDDQVTGALNALSTQKTAAISAVDSIHFPQSLINGATTAQGGVDAVTKQIKAIPDYVATNLDGWLLSSGKKLTDGVLRAEADLDMIVDDVANQLLTHIEDLRTSVGTTVNTNAKAVLKTLSDYGTSFTTEVCNALTNLQNAATNAALHELESLRRTLEEAAGRLAEAIAQALPIDDIQLPSGASVLPLLQRAFGSVPSIQNLGFSLPNAAYFFKPQIPNVDLTPVLTAVQDLVPNLTPLSTLVPTFSLLDRALPVPHLPNFDLNNVFPDFAGLNLSNLFPSLKMPAGSSDAVKVTHGLDQQSRTAWVQADIDLKTDTATIFSLGPMALQINTPQFTSTVRAQAGSNGQVSRQATGAITGDWQLLIGGSPMITLVSTAITFDQDGKVHVNVSPDRVQLSAALSFIQQIIARYTSPNSGFGIFPSATGIETRLALPIPDTSLGTTGITNLTFNFVFGLTWSPKFQINAGFGLASPNAPFNVAIYILGGGGHLQATANYTPGQSLTCTLDMALDASAALAISLGPISGSVHINLGMRFVFNSGQGDLSLGIFLLIGGEVSVLGIVSASILLRLEATYENGSFTCRGLFSISIKICWCFTLNVSQEVSCRLGSGGGLAYNESLSPFGIGEAAPLLLGDASISTVPASQELSQYPGLAEQYLELIS